MKIVSKKLCLAISIIGINNEKKIQCFKVFLRSTFIQHCSGENEHTYQDISIDLSTIRDM